jgi:hypothetical protein
MPVNQWFLGTKLGCLLVQSKGAKPGACTIKLFTKVINTVDHQLLA